MSFVIFDTEYTTWKGCNEIVHLLGIESAVKNLNIHNALFDVYSILEGLKYFKQDKDFILEHTRAAV